MNRLRVCASFTTAALAGIGLSITVASETEASSLLPDAVADVIVYANGNQSSQVGADVSTAPAQMITGLSALGTASAEGTASIQPSPNVSASASVSGVGEATSYAWVESYFSVIGPSNTSVQLDITGSGSITQPLTSANQAYLQISSPTATLLLATACLGTPSTNCSGPNNGTFSVNAQLSVESDELDNMQLLVSLVADTLPFGAGIDTESGYVDPMITIDPTFALENPGFSLEFSANAGNLEVTPLPAALPLFATGLGGLGLLGWRRKRKAQAA